MQFQYSKKRATGRIVISNTPQGELADPVFAEKSELVAFLEDHAIKGVVLQSEGRHFCSGTDPQHLGELLGDGETFAKKLEQVRELLGVLRYAPVPVVAAIHGCCLGVGLEIALACHFRIAAKTAMFGFFDAGHEMLPTMERVVWAQQLIGRGKLIELILNGRMISAKEALSLGLIDGVSPAASLEKEAGKFLDSLVADRSAMVVRSVMEAIHNGTRMNRTEALNDESRLLCRLAATVKQGLTPP
jgi:enoyl-CoA hydratase/carnithine racemase